MKNAVTRRRLLATTAPAALMLLLSGPGLANVAALPPVTVWKSPTCGCCGRWSEHMRQAGFTLTVHETADLAPVKQAHGIPDNLVACHTAEVGGYVIEGHVPPTDIVRLLTERPAAKGLAVPGMPSSSPGMDQPTGESYEVTLFGAPGGNRVFARHS